MPVSPSANMILTRGPLLDYLCIAVEQNMTKEKLIAILQELLKTDYELDFLKELKREDLEKLVACIRDRVDQSGK
jgi:hypothetical protein